jgi:DNA-binding SARP family transcriptional activator
VSRVSGGSGGLFSKRSGGPTRGDGRADDEDGGDLSNRREPESGRDWGLSDSFGRASMEDRIESARRESAPACVQTLGDFRVYLATSEDRWVEAPDRVRWGHGRALELLALLLLHRRSLTRSEVAAMLWPDGESGRRAKLLRNALWNLRSALDNLSALVVGHAEREGPSGAPIAQLTLRESAHTLRLVATPLPVIKRGAGSREDRGEEGASAQRLTRMTRPGYGGAPGMSSGIWCDAPAFETACERVGGATTPEERLRWSNVALTMYAGVFMPGIERAAWIAGQRARLEERWARVCVDAAGALRRMRELDRALRLLLDVVERRPQHAEAAHHAMTLLASQGRVADALEVYERARRAFRQAYGSETDTLRRLAAEIRGGRFLVERPRRNSGAYWRVEPPDVEEW